MRQRVPVRRTGRVSSPTALRDRALGPDLARGAMLLFIALANSHYFLDAPAHLGGFPAAPSGVDAVTTWAIATFVDGRAFPMFGLLFGYGVAHVVRRQTGPPRETRRLLWRRAAVLIAVGFVDGLLFYVGDILAAYGVLLLLGAWAVHWRDRWLLAVAAVWFVVTALPSSDSGSTSTDGPDATALPTHLLDAVDERLFVVGFVALLGPLGFVTPFLVGLWAGRRRVLEQPAAHLRLLRTVALVGIPAAVLGAQPVALVLAGAVDVPSDHALTYLGPLHDATGRLGGAGYAALAALLATRLTEGRVVRALAATGQRSMTCYLCQSPVWTLLFATYLLDLSATLNVTALALVAVATWFGTVLLASALERRGVRGPFEVLVRRVTYQ